ncbi:hypothetical protein C6P61_10245 [Malikia spinosa]|jgi:hypothetical protein|uniref:Uncharacterized protein n=1 Tax=Malikia spinosa TaxID=86180 RepID=A0A2S9KDU2_9BURK|nr:hypothetical protein [Malikia spinosa]PRD68594.1 hypothetical protein C6P61_10245 [Malikia spinosa]
MTSEAPPQTDPGGTQPAAVVRPDRLRQVVPVLLSTLLTLLVLAPVAYVVNRKLPPSLATVDLQALVDEEQKRTLDVIGKGGELSDEQRAVAQQLTVDFARKLSSTVDALGQECGCVIINKAALLGGVAIDYTDQVRARIR